MRRVGLVFLTYCIFIFSVLPVSASSVTDTVKAGNKLYKQQKYDEALQEYNEAKTIEPDSDIVHFNIGTAQYKKGQYEEAIGAFISSLATEDKSLEAQATYNIANSKYRLGEEKADSAPSEAVGLYRESLDYFKRAIELDEKNGDAKYNHELVEKKLRILLEKLKNRQEEEKESEGEDNEEQEKQDQEQQQSGDRGEEKEREKQETGTSDQEDQKPAHQESAESEASQPDEGEGTESALPDEERGEEMSPEEAQMLLEAFGEDESLDVLEKRSMGYQREVLKDW
jgi:tetratricopeptide (TPR) repeat protein